MPQLRRNPTLAIKYVFKINAFQNFQIGEKKIRSVKKNDSRSLGHVVFLRKSADRSATTRPLPTSYPTNRLLFPRIPTITQLRPEFPVVVSTALERADGP